MVINILTNLFHFIYIHFFCFTQECQRNANRDKFRLHDLLAVPMQRILKYSLLMKELIKESEVEDKEILGQALEAMQVS